jgi:NAD(P)H-hydrate epimerase
MHVKRKPESLKNKAVTAADAKKLDTLVQKKFGVRGIIMMELAGFEIYRRVALKVKRRAKISVICATGNNGGDGFVAARHLYNNGHDVKIYIIGKMRGMKQDAGENLKIAKKIGIKTKFMRGDNCLSALKREIRKSDAVVDAVFGIGLTREVKGYYRDLIDIINQSGKYVVSADVPSGLDADTGKAHGVAVKANETVTMGAPKKGMFVNDGPHHCGRVVVADISWPVAR